MVEVDSKEINVEMDDSSTSIEIDDNNTEMNINEINVEFDSSVESIELNDDVLRMIEKNHSKLENLDYEHSGHTGFASKDDIIKDASNINYEDNFGYGADNIQNALDEAFSALDTKAESGDLDNLVSYSINQNKSDAQKARARKNIEAKKDVIDLGEIDLESYDWDMGVYLQEIIEEGEYKFAGSDGIDYILKVVHIGDNQIGQEYYSSEEGYEYKYFRTGFYDEDNKKYTWNEWTDFITYQNAINTFAPKNHVHYKQISTASNIRTYLDTFNQYGEFSISSTADKEKYWLFTDYYNVTVNGKNDYRRMQKYYSISEPWKVYSRSGLYDNVTKKTSWTVWYINEGVEE